MGHVSLSDLLALPTPPDMVDGYRDGFADNRDDLPETFGNRSEAYRFGWLNGRDDRTGSPRDTAAAIREEAYRIIVGGLN